MALLLSASSALVATRPPPSNFSRAPHTPTKLFAVLLVHKSLLLPTPPSESRVQRCAPAKKRPQRWNQQTREFEQILGGRLEVVEEEVMSFWGGSYGTTKIDCNQVVVRSFRLVRLDPEVPKRDFIFFVGVQRRTRIPDWKEDSRGLGKGAPDGVLYRSS